MSLEIKYEKELKELFRELFFESWMDESEYTEMEGAIMSVCNTSYKRMSDEIQVSIDNGYSLEFQLDLIRKYFTK